MLKFGTDPEVFVTDGKRVKGLFNIVPPIALITDFGVPFEVNSSGKKQLLKTDDFAVIEDGAAFETNISPTNNPVVFAQRHRDALSAISDLVGKYGLFVTNDIVGHFDTNKYWNGRDESFRHCVIFGCDPDQSLYKDVATENGGTNTIQQPVAGILDVSTYPYRYAGGHLHVEFDEHTAGIVGDLQYAIGYMFDWFVQTFVVSAHAGQNEAIGMETLRLKHYGRPGTFRIQQYKDSSGFEFRPPSSWWLNATQTVVDSVLERANMVRDLVTSGGEEAVIEFMDKFFDRRLELFNTLVSFDVEHSGRLNMEVTNG